MKNKLISAILMLGILLTGCKSSSYYGTYSFQMGKDKGFHLKAEMVLSKEDFVKEDGTTNGKKFNFTMDIGTSEEGDGTTPAPSSSDIGIFSLLPNPLELDGHYTLGDKSPRDRTTVNLNFTIIDSFADLVRTLVQSDDIDSASIINLFIFTELDKTNIYFTIPVSLDDLYYQLYWYGYDITTSDVDHIIVTPHAFGTVPTSDDVVEINKTYPSTHDGKSYKIYHTLELGLVKD